MERLYRWLLKAYPAEFRHQYEELMLQLFRDQRRTTPALRFWTRLFVDWLCSVPKQWNPRTRHGSPRLTEPARAAIFFARYEASSFARREITLEHLLLGLLRHDYDLQVALGKTAIGDIVRQIEASEPAGRRTPPQEDLPLSAACKQVLGACKGGQVTTRQLLEAIRQQDSTLAARLLRTYL